MPHKTYRNAAKDYFRAHGGKLRPDEAPRDPAMQPSDAWLLVVIKYAERDERPADLPNIFATGDWINRTIFLDSELAGGFSRLEAGGLIKIDGKGCAVTDKFHQVWTAAKAERRSAPHDQVVALRKYFGISN